MGTALVPAEHIVVRGGLAAGGFHKRNAGQQTPIQFVGIGCLYEFRYVSRGRAIEFLEEALKRLQTLIAPMFAGTGPIGLVG